MWRLVYIDALGGSNGLQLPAKAIADGLHVDAVTIAAHTGTQNSLRQIVADIQPELAPDLLPDIFRDPVVDLRAQKQLFYGAFSSP